MPSAVLRSEMWPALRTLQCWVSRSLRAQAVWELFFGGRDEILIYSVGLSRNNDSPTLPSEFNYCAEGLHTGVFTQPGPEADIREMRITGIRRTENQNRAYSVAVRKPGQDQKKPRRGRRGFLGDQGDHMR